MSTQPASPPDPLIAARHAEVRRLARERGLIRRGGKNRIVSARMSEELLAAAKQRTGITSDSELLETAVASLVLGDDFGEWLLTQRGRLPKDFELGL